MGENSKYAFVIMLILFYIFILIKVRNIKKSTQREIARLGKDLYINLLFAGIWIVVLVIYVHFSAVRFTKVYDILKGQYVKSVFQMFDLEYLKDLQEYFYNNLMLTELNWLPYYRSTVVRDMIMIVMCVLNAATYILRVTSRDKLCENGVFEYGNVTKWEEVIEYNWGECGKGYYKLNLYCNPSKFQKKILRMEELPKRTYKIYSKDKENVDNFLKTVIKEKNSDDIEQAQQ